MSIPPRAHNDMAGTENSIKGVLAEFSVPILPKIVGETTRESLIKINQLIGGNVDPVASNPGGGRHVHLALTMTAEYYLARQEMCLFLRITL